MNLLLDLSVIEMKWPIYSNLYLRSGLTYVPYFSASSIINGKKYNYTLNPQLLNVPVGLGFQSFLTDKISLSLLYSRWMYSDFVNKRFNSFSSYFSKMFADKGLQSVQVTIRYHLSEKGWQ
ncbi:hypothetical protein EP331_15175 [bacterium]|nr:MAG: hypothetical protein EP331_15175 [bacterium]